VSRTGDPGARGSTRRARVIVKSARPPFHEGSDPRPALSTQVERDGAIRRVQIAARRLAVRQRTDEANATGITLSSFPGRLGAGSEVKASLAGEDRQLVGCVRASNSVAEVCERHRGSEKRVPWHRGTPTGAQSSWCFQELHGLAKASTTGSVVAKPRRRGRPEPGVRKGIAGRRLSQDGSHPGSSLGSLVHAGGLEDGLGGSQGCEHARA